MLLKSGGDFKRGVSRSGADPDGSLVVSKSVVDLDGSVVVSKSVNDSDGRSGGGGVVKCEG